MVDPNLLVFSCDRWDHKQLMISVLVMRCLVASTASLVDGFVFFFWAGNVMFCLTESSFLVMQC